MCVSSLILSTFSDDSVVDLPALDQLAALVQLIRYLPQLQPRVPEGKWCLWPAEQLTTDHEIACKLVTDICRVLSWETDRGFLQMLADAENALLYLCGECEAYAMRREYDRLATLGQSTDHLGSESSVMGDRFMSALGEDNYDPKSLNLSRVSRLPALSLHPIGIKR